MSSDQNQIFPLTPERYSGKYWRAYPTLQFAKTHTSCPLVLNETFKAALSMPFGFSKEKGNRMPLALMGIESEKNLYVSSEGVWLGRYLPAFFRGYPFCILPDQNENQVLCVDESSGLINEDEEGWAFFDSDNSPSERTKQTLSFFEELASAHNLTKETCKTIEAENLFVPWQISVIGTDGEELTIDIMDRIDEEALNSLDPESLIKLQQSGAMALIYAHLVSLQNLQLIERLIALETKPDVSPETQDLGFSLSDDSNKELNFDF